MQRILIKQLKLFQLKLSQLKYTKSAWLLHSIPIWNESSLDISNECIVSVSVAFLEMDRYQVLVYFVNSQSALIFDRCNVFLAFFYHDILWSIYQMGLLRLRSDGSRLEELLDMIASIEKSVPFGCFDAATTAAPPHVFDAPSNILHFESCLNFPQRNWLQLIGIPLFVVYLHSYWEYYAFEAHSQTSVSVHISFNCVVHILFLLHNDHIIFHQKSHSSDMSTTGTTGTLVSSRKWKHIQTKNYKYWRSKIFRNFRINVSTIMLTHHRVEIHLAFHQSFASVLDCSLAD